MVAMKPKKTNPELWCVILLPTEPPLPPLPPLVPHSFPVVSGLGISSSPPHSPRHCWPRDTRPRLDLHCTASKLVLLITLSDCHSAQISSEASPLLSHPLPTSLSILTSWHFSSGFFHSEEHCPREPHVMASSCLTQ